LDDASDADEIGAILNRNRGSAEWWVLRSVTFLGVVGDAVNENDAATAVWAMACAERCRSMLVFKEHLEEVVFMGQSAKRIIDILRTWDVNRQNSDERFWQLTFAENSYALSQVFATPLVFIQ
jgi:hypothetical protein